MPAEKEYRDLLLEAAARAHRDVTGLLDEYRKALPYFKKSKVRTGFNDAQKTGQEEDSYEWWFERDKDFVVRRVRVGLRAGRLHYLLNGTFHPHLVAGAGWREKPNWGNGLMGSEHEEQVICESTDVSDLRAALSQAISVAF